LSTTRELSDKSEKNNYRKKQKRRRGVRGTKPRTNKTGAPGGFPMLMGQHGTTTFQEKGGRNKVDRGSGELSHVLGIGLYINETCFDRLEKRKAGAARRARGAQAAARRGGEARAARESKNK